ncbi:MAG: hypothetical protein AAF696_27280, partial [Bacteroidota bacterium]
MKPLLQHVYKYSREQFEWRLYLSLAVFLSILFIFNYSLDFEDQYIDRISTYPLRALAFMAFLFFPFWMAAYLIARFRKKDFLSKREFWIKAVIAFACVGLYRGIMFEGEFCRWLDMDGCRFIWRVIRRFNR